MIAVLALASAIAAPAADDAVFLTVAYCPDLFSGMGAVVRVNHTDGAFTIQGKFALPSSSIGLLLVGRRDELRLLGLVAPRAPRLLAFGAVALRHRRQEIATATGRPPSPRLAEAGRRIRLARRALARKTQVLRRQRRPALRSSAKSAAQRLRPPQHRQTWSK